MIELLRQAWSDEPVNYHGQFFDYADVCVLPKPVQRPHPPLWVGCSLSEESYHWTGAHGFNLMSLPYLIPADIGNYVKTYRKALIDAGYDPATRRTLGKCHVYVADSLAAAEREAIPYLENYHDVHKAADPGRVRRVRVERDFASQVARGFIIAGDPQRCIDAIHRLREDMGLDTFSGTFHFGGMPHEMALKNIRRFAEHVMPAFQGE